MEESPRNRLGGTYFVVHSYVYVHSGVNLCTVLRITFVKMVCTPLPRLRCVNGTGP